MQNTRIADLLRRRHHVTAYSTSHAGVRSPGRHRQQRANRESHLQVASESWHQRCAAADSSDRSLTSAAQYDGSCCSRGFNADRDLAAVLMEYNKMLSYRRETALQCAL